MNIYLVLSKKKPENEIKTSPIQQVSHKACLGTQKDILQ